MNCSPTNHQSMIITNRCLLCKYVLLGPMDGFPCSILQSEKMPPGCNGRYRGRNLIPLRTRSWANFAPWSNPTFQGLTPPQSTSVEALSRVIPSRPFSLLSLWNPCYDGLLSGPRGTAHPTNRTNPQQPLSHTTTTATPTTLASRLDPSKTWKSIFKNCTSLANTPDSN